MARRASGSLALCCLPCPCAAPVAPYRSDAEASDTASCQIRGSAPRGHLRYPARRTLAWRPASRTAGPSTSGGRFVCWLVGSTTRPAYEASPPPWGGLVAVGMRKISRMSLSSWLVTATLPDPRPAPPGGPAPLPRPLNRHAGVKGRVAGPPGVSGGPVTMAAGVTGAGAVAARRRRRPSRWGRRPAPWPALGRGAGRRRGGR
jgi:hypothetical protein